MRLVCLQISDNILDGHLNGAAGNATYLSLTSQNVMIEIMGKEIQNAIVMLCSSGQGSCHLLGYDGRNN